MRPANRDGAVEGRDADREQGAPGRDGRQGGVNADAVMQPHVCARSGLVDVAAAARDDGHGQLSKFRLTGARPVPLPDEPISPVDPEVVGAVDEDVGHRRVADEPRERAEIGCTGPGLQTHHRRTRRGWFGARARAGGRGGHGARRAQHGCRDEGFARVRCLVWVDVRVLNARHAHDRTSAGCRTARPPPILWTTSGGSPVWRTGNALAHFASTVLNSYRR
jgi:hypothetical protein